MNSKILVESMIIVDYTQKTEHWLQEEDLKAHGKL
jgi:hypothetical protein